MSERLKRSLIERIGATGPITFAEFMEAALYDPEDGFYARPPVGEHGHFVTSPHVSVAFAALIARQLAEVWDILGHPRRLPIVEVGAGDGTLAGQLLEAAARVPDLARAISYLAVERSPGARRALQARGIATADSLEAVAPMTGCVVANELLDNLPFHRLRRSNDRVVEVRVGAHENHLVEVETDPSPTLLEDLNGSLQEGTEQPVSLGMRSLVADIGRALARGYAFFFDYGFAWGESPGPVHAYRDQRALPEILEDPGSRDLTAGVDLAAVARAAEDAGLTVWGPVSQRNALLALGYRSWALALGDRRGEAQAAGNWREANRIFAEQSKASILVDEAKLGGLRLIALATPDLPAPAAVLADPDAER
ncbi:MAG: SAM-dependent methyltransferase [Actinomycetota bacterium]